MLDSKASGTRPAYADAVRTFRIEDAMARLEGDLAGKVNACVECCDRHCGENRLALRWIGADGRLETFSFEDLRAMSARVAHMLKAQGIGPGDVVAALLPRVPELIGFILGAWRLGAVYQPLFTAFGPKAIEHRFQTAATKLVVTNLANRGKLNEIVNCPKIATVLAPAISTSGKSSPKDPARSSR